MKRLFLFWVVLFLLPQVSFGQQQDSLFGVYKNTRGDSLISEALYSFLSQSADLQSDSLDLLLQKAKLRISADHMAQGFLMEKCGMALRKRKAHYQASKSFKDALEEYRIADSPEDEVRVIRSLALLSKIMDVLEDAQNYCFEGLKIAEELNDHELSTLFLRNIGVNYTKMQSFANAEKKLKRAIRISKKYGDTVGIIYGYMSLGNAYKAQDKYELASNSYMTSLDMAEITQNKRALAGNYNNIASNLNKQDRFEEAIEYYFKAIPINKASGNKLWESYNYNNLGNVYSSLGKFQLALKFQLMSYELKVEMNDKEGMVTSYINLAESYRDLGDYKKAAEFYDLYTESFQSSLLEQNLLNLNELSAKYEDEKKMERIAQMDTLRQLDSLKIIASNESIRKGKSLQRSMWGGVILLVLFSTYLIYSIRQKKKVNSELSETQDKLSQKNKDLTDSINYAKHIQENILTSTQVMRDEFDETLIIYKPKDIVSGDFYWFKSFEKSFVFALADCTGHGVPGAFMSLICTSAINAVTSDAATKSPGNALSQIDTIVNQTLNGASDGKGKTLADGMDVALCSINRETGVLQYSGAYRPLIVIRNGEIMRFRGDKFSIGGGAFRKKEFTEHQIQLETNDIVYLFSDGFPDQFGGERGKKLKIRPFLKVVSELHSKPLQEQEELLNSFLASWMDGYEQLDDISVIAVRYK